LIPGLDTGGAEAMLLKLVTRLDARRFESHVVTMLEGGALVPRFHAANVPLESLRMARGVPNPAALLRFVRRARALRPDILQSWLHPADLLASVAWPFTHRPALLWNIRSSEVDLSHYSPVHWMVIKSLPHVSRWVDGAIVNSTAGQLVHEAAGYRNRWHLIPNGFDTEVFRPDPGRAPAIRAALGLRGDVPVVGMVARFDPMKDHDTLLAAARRVVGAHFVLIGKHVTPDNPALAAAIERHGVRDRVHPLGERLDVAECLRALDVHVLSSCGEGLPNAVGEAMATGVPCVVTDVGDAAQLVGDTGRIVPPRDPAALAAAVTELLALPQAARAALGERARARVARDYGLASVVAAYERVYESYARMR
jgi:glycosyltransferase involved in cell wall biosynthesis